MLRFTISWNEYCQGIFFLKALHQLLYFVLGRFSSRSQWVCSGTGAPALPRGSVGPWVRQRYRWPRLNGVFHCTEILREDAASHLGPFIPGAVPRAGEAGGIWCPPVAHRGNPSCVRHRRVETNSEIKVYCVKSSFT